MERADRAPVATFHAPGLAAARDAVALDEDAAHHARVRRLAAGDPVRLSDGLGTMARGAIARIAKGSVDVAVDEGSRAAVPRPYPLHLLVPVADRDRMLWLAEKCAELAVASWTPVVFARSRSVSPRGEGAAFRDKVRRRMISALEQSAGAWLPEVHEELEVAAAAASFGGAARLLLDAAGAPILGLLEGDAPELAFALGPEGGLDLAERDAFVDAGWRPAALSPTVLRFETAAVAAAAVARASTLDRSR